MKLNELYIRTPTYIVQTLRADVYNQLKELLKFINNIRKELNINKNLENLENTEETI